MPVCVCVCVCVCVGVCPCVPVCVCVFWGALTLLPTQVRKAVEEPNYLLVALERGRNLASVSSAASPYAVVEHGGAVMETAPVAGTTHPIWGAHFLFEVHTTAKGEGQPRIII